MCLFCVYGRVCVLKREIWLSVVSVKAPWACCRHGNALCFFYYSLSCPRMCRSISRPRIFNYLITRDWNALTKTNLHKKRNNHGNNSNNSFSFCDADVCFCTYVYLKKIKIARDEDISSWRYRLIHHHTCPPSKINIFNTFFLFRLIVREGIFFLMRII